MMFLGSIMLEKKCKYPSAIVSVYSILMIVSQPTIAQDNQATSSFLETVRANSALKKKAIDVKALQAQYELRRLKKHLQILESKQPQKNLHIPDVAKRDNEAPRILVSAFRIEDVTEFPKLGITREKVEALAEKLRADLMLEEHKNNDNYSELEALSKQLGSLRLNDQFDHKALVQMKLLLQEQENKRGLSYADLEYISNQLTAFYRQSGLFLAQVFIPPQDVEKGIVTLKVSEGVLGKIHVENNKRYNDDQIRRPFVRLESEGVKHHEIEEGLYLVNDLPGLSVFGYFSKGEASGETHLNLKVREEKRWAYRSRLDNHGALLTGKHRFYNGLSLFNPLGLSDELTLGYLSSHDVNHFDRDYGSDLWQFNYQVPITSRWNWNVSADNNDFKLRDHSDQNSVINLLELEGVNRTYAMGVEYQHRRSRAINMASRLRLTEKKTEQNAVVVLPGADEHARGAEVGFYIDALGSEIPMLNMADITLKYGHRLASTTETLFDPSYYTFTVDTSSLFFVPQPFVEERGRLIVKSRWQLSQGALPAFEQVALGGVNGVRAFSVRDFSGDQAAIINAEWFFGLSERWNPTLWGNQRLGDVFQLGFIVDMGYGSLQSEEKGESNDWAYLSGAGLLLSCNWTKSVSSQLSIALPLSAQSSIEGMGEVANSPQIFAEMSMSF